MPDPIGGEGCAILSVHRVTGGDDDLFTPLSVHRDLTGDVRAAGTSHGGRRTCGLWRLPAAIWYIDAVNTPYRGARSDVLRCAPMSRKFRIKDLCRLFNGSELSHVFIPTGPGVGEFKIPHPGLPLLVNLN